MIRATLLLLLLSTTAAGQSWTCPPQGSWCPPQPRPPEVEETPPVGSAGTPEFSPRPPANPPLPTPPPASAPPTPPQPTLDVQAWEAWQREQSDNAREQLTILQTLVVAVENQRCECQPCDLSEVNAKLDALAGQVGGITPIPPAQPQSEQHVVIVADQNAPYWQRLAEQVERTKQTYHGVQVAGLPKFPVGLHPQAVVYRNSVPVRIVKGQYEVEALLSRLARGESI